MTIKVDFYVFDLFMTQIAQGGDELSDMIAKIAFVAEAIDGTVWSGKAAKAYKEKMEALQSEVADLKDFIYNMRDTIDKIFKEYLEAEKENMTLSGSLPTDLF